MQKELVLLPMTARELSHELRTPLVPILGLAQKLLETELTSEQKSCVEDILSAGKQLVKLANTLTKEITRLACSDTVNDEELRELTSLLIEQIQDKDNTKKLNLCLFG